MKPLVLFGLAALVACGADDAEICDASTGSLTGQILFGTADYPGSSAAFARVQAWDEAAGESQDDALLISSDEEGFYSVDLPSATWTLAAISDDSMSFSSTSTTLVVEACDDLSLDFYLDNGFGK